MLSESAQEYIYDGSKYTEPGNEKKKNLNVSVYVATLRFSGRFYKKCQKSHRNSLKKCCELSFSPIFKMLVPKIS